MNSIKLALLATGFVAAAASAQTIVVRSSGPSAVTYPVGAVVAADKPLVLKARDEVVILDAKGTRTFKGPGRFTAATPQQVAGMRTAVAGLFTNQNGRKARIGAVRGTGSAAKTPPSIWDVDVARSSTVCVMNTGNVRLWRPDADAAAELAIVRASDGKAQTLAWSKGQATAAWPKTLPVRAGETYRLGAPGAEGRPVNFAVLSPAPTGWDAMTQAFAANRCQGQMDQLLRASGPAAITTVTTTGG